MPESSPDRIEVDRSIQALIESVPHLEALLLLWHSKGLLWSPEQLASRLWIEAEAARQILKDLTRDQLIQAVPDEKYRYDGDPERDRLLEAVDTVYRNEMIRISDLIHAKGSLAVREFARAFRFKKEQE